MPATVVGAAQPARQLGRWPPLDAARGADGLKRGNKLAQPAASSSMKYARGRHAPAGGRRARATTRAMLA